MKRLAPIDHKILLAMIQGHDAASICVITGITDHAVRMRTKRMREICECRTTYQLVALEVVNLMESDTALPDIKIRAKGAGA